MEELKRAHDLAKEFLSSFPESDRDEHTESLAEHVRVWLVSSVFSIEPAVLKHCSEEKKSILWKHVPFFAKDKSFFSCYKIMTGDITNVLFFGQLFGFIANEMKCDAIGEGMVCGEDCHLMYDPKRGYGYYWACADRKHKSKISILKHSWFEGCRKLLECFDCIILHMLKVAREDQSAVLNVSKRAITTWIGMYQNLCSDMLATVKTLISKSYDIDGTFLSGRMTKKMSYGRRRGALKYREKTLVIVQQRNSRRMAVIVSEVHENAEMADQIASQTIERGTPGFSDGGHSKISAWVHLPDVVGSPVKSVNHSKEFVNTEEGEMKGAHINFGENRNKLLKKWLIAHRGGGSTTKASLVSNLGEYVFYQWFTPGGSNEAVYKCLMFFFSLWICNGFSVEQAADLIELGSGTEPLWSTDEKVVEGAVPLVQVHEPVKNRPHSPFTRIKRKHGMNCALEWEARQLCELFGYTRCKCRKYDLLTCCIHDGKQENESKMSSSEGGEDVDCVNVPLCRCICSNQVTQEIYSKATPQERVKLNLVKRRTKW